MADDQASSVISMDIKEIMQVIPHRYPMLLVDRILELDLENDRILAVKSCTMNEAFFQGHFPGAPLMPGVLILEALAQTGAVFASKKMQKEKICVLLGINKAKFRTPVKPGDQLMLECESIHYGHSGGKIKARAYVGKSTCAEAEIAFAFADKQTI